MNRDRIRRALAVRLQRVVDRLDPEAAEQREEERLVLRTLGFWTYGTYMWSSVHVMVKRALTKARAVACADEFPDTRIERCPHCKREKDTPRGLTFCSSCTELPPKPRPRPVPDGLPR